MNYEKIYESIITRAKTRSFPNCYTEKHHIIPRCMGGGDEESNLAILTPEEHYVAHQLLVKIHPTNRKLLYAAHALSKLHSRNHPLSRKLSNKKYRWLKRRHSILQRTGDTVTCQCGVAFYASNYRLKKYRNHYCSSDCQKKFNPKERSKNIKYVTVPCLSCGEEMILSERYYNYTNKKHCSYECAGSSQSKRQGGVIEITCYICALQFIVSNSYYLKHQKNNICCSPKCTSIKRQQKLKFV